MKKIVQKIILTTLLLLSYNGLSQSRYYDKATDMDVNGIFIGGTYTKQQIEAKWGSPTEYWSGMSEFGLNEDYYYSDNLFRFSDNGIFHSFIIETPGFAVYSAFKGGIKVGDKVVKIQLIGIGTLTKIDEESYYLIRKDWDDPIIIKHSDGVITQISFETSI